MATLLRPDNKQPAAYVTSRNGYICLRTDCITPSVMWFSEAAINKLNPVQGCELPPVVTCTAIVVWKPLVVYITADMIGNERKGIPGIDIGKSSGVVFKDAEAA